MIRYRPWLCLGYLIFMSVIELLWQVPALAMREFFNLLAGEAPVTLGLWAVVASLVASKVGTFIGSCGINITMIPFYVHTTTLLRKNLLQHILKRYLLNILGSEPFDRLRTGAG